MKNNLKKAQKTYILALAANKTAQKIIDGLMDEFIESNGVDLDNDDLDAVNDKFSALYPNELEAVRVSRELLQTAENELIKLSLVVVKKDLPAGTVETLEKDAAKNYTTKVKLIDLALQLKIYGVCKS